MILRVRLWRRLDWFVGYRPVVLVGMGFFRACFKSQRLSPLHPGGGLGTIICIGWVDQNQAMTASIGGTRELALILHDKVEGRSQLVGGAPIPEACPAWM